MRKNDIYLFLVVIGGRAPNANIELHDVRWVIGKKIEDTFESLRNDWFGSIEGLHIDSYKKIKTIDGYKINLRNIEKSKKGRNNLKKDKKNNKKLWFVNLGGYQSDSMQEKHEFGLVVASSSLEAKNKAKSKWLNGYEKKHKDDIASLKNLITLDDCEVIKNIDNWEIELTLDSNFVKENNYPDWYGYKRIDKI